MEPSEIILHISGGKIENIYDERLDLSSLGHVTITRASNVDPDDSGLWWTDLAQSHGPRIGPFKLRSEALEAEHHWLEENRIKIM